MARLTPGAATERDSALFDDMMQGYGIEAARSTATVAIVLASGPASVPANASADEVRFAEAMGSLYTGPDAGTVAKAQAKPGMMGGR